jgi:hypothetical protein
LRILDFGLHRCRLWFRCGTPVPAGGGWSRYPRRTMHCTFENS